MVTKKATIFAREHSIAGVRFMVRMGCGCVMFARDRELAMA